MPTRPPARRYELNELDEVDAFNEQLADLDLLECADIAARSVDLLRLDADDSTAALSALVLDDASPRGFAAPARALDFKTAHRSAAFAQSHSKRNHIMSKNFGRRRC